jgi:hypothetical protein
MLPTDEANEMPSTQRTSKITTKVVNKSIFTNPPNKIYLPRCEYIDRSLTCLTLPELP